MNVKQPKIVSKMVRGLINQLTKEGVPREPLLRQQSIDENLLNSADYFFPLSAYNELYRLGEEATSNSYIGLTFGAESDRDVGSELGLISSTCETVADVLKYQLRFSPLVRNFDQFELITDADNLIVRWSTDVPVSFHLVEEIFARRTIFIQKFVLNSDKTVFEAIHFSHHLGRRDLTKIEAILGCPIKFDQPFNQFICNKATLSLPLLTPDRDLRHFYEELAQKKLVNLTQTSIIDTVSQLLISALPDVLTLDTLSKNLSISPRTLQRQLQKHGYTLKDLYSEVKQTVALDSLKAGHSLMAISIKLGFSEQSAFQRAFKRWQGCTPKEFQQLYLDNSDSET